MSLPSIPETMTREEFEAHMKTVGSEVYLRDDAGDLYGTVRYDYGYPTTPWIFDYLGECGRYEQFTRKTVILGREVEAVGERCAAWLHEPYIKRFSSLEALSFFVAFVGLEYS